ncbi:hypothetical protein ACFC1L_39885 [Streptomyces sp. NPDC056210]|uniref:hypothetical protein n=1 Tax=Streptomyces sp. NPDC056210 TaxID=3345746 RepID=UPI0035D8CF02
MSLMKRWIDDRAHYYGAGLIAGSEDNVFRLAEEISGLHEDALAYADPMCAMEMLWDSLYTGWIHGRRPEEAEGVIPVHA